MRVLRSKKIIYGLLGFVSLTSCLFDLCHGAQGPTKRRNPCLHEVMEAPYLDLESSVRWWSRDYLRDVYFTDALKGWALGGDGSIFSTVDGGRTWRNKKLTTPPSGFLAMQIGFQTPQTGWIAAEGQFFKTSDGGRIWRRAAAPVMCTEKIYYATPEVGWLLSKVAQLLKTNDGGRTWRRANIDEMPIDVACFSERECIIVGANGMVSTTFDGNAWVARKSPRTGTDIIQVKVTRDGVAWALGAESRSRYLLRSDDKGQTWKVIGKELPDVVRRLMFWGKNNGIIAGTAIHLTNDGGVTWQYVKMPGGAAPYLNGLYFVDDKLGWAVGDFKSILHTMDGGKTWIIQHAEGLPK